MRWHVFDDYPRFFQLPEDALICSVAEKLSYAAAHYWPGHVSNLFFVRFTNFRKRPELLCKSSGRSLSNMSDSQCIKKAVQSRSHGGPNCSI